MKITHGAFVKFLEDNLEKSDFQKRVEFSQPRKLASIFGRLFESEPSQPTQDQLNKLALLMAESPDDRSGESSDISAGMTFFGQFIDHDLTLDAISEVGVSADVKPGLPNFRTPRLDLDSVYGLGPNISSYLYDGREKFVVGTPENSQDLPRNAANVALIGDPRNDENLFLSQLHSLFLNFHNTLFENGPYAGNFCKTRSLVRRAYQGVVLYEYLPAIVHESVLDPLMEQFYSGEMKSPVANNDTPDMPLEFSAAAFRYGHSQIRSGYTVNSETQCGLFETGGFRAVPKNKNLDWSFFFDFGDSRVQFARKIDTKIVDALYHLPDRVSGGEGKSLPRRNLIRGQHTFGLPFGEDIAVELKAPPIHPRDLPKILEAELEHIPLWFYVLAEAEQPEFDGQLGPVGGSIVAGTLLNLLIRDPDSIANKPLEPAELGWSSFSMANLVKMALGQ